MIIRLQLLIIITLILTVQSLADSISIIHSNVDGYSFEHRNRFPQGEYFCAVEVDSQIHLKKISVTTRDTMVSGYDSHTEGFILTTDFSYNSLFAVHGVPDLKEGPIKTWYYNQSFIENGKDSITYSPTDFSRLFFIGTDTLKITGSWIPGTYQNALVWKYFFGNTERTLAKVEEDGVMGNEEIFGVYDLIIWIGDLDGDSKNPHAEQGALSSP